MNEIEYKSVLNGSLNLKDYIKNKEKIVGKYSTISFPDDDMWWPRGKSYACTGGLTKNNFFEICPVRDGCCHYFSPDNSDSFPLTDPFDDFTIEKGCALFLKRTAELYRMRREEIEATKNQHEAEISTKQMLLNK